MTFYNEMQSVASELLTEFNQGVIAYIRVTPGTGPADDPGPATETPFRLSATARGVKFKYVHESLALASDLQVTAAASPALVADFADESVLRGFVVMDGQRYKIVRAIPIPAAGVPAAFVLIVRK